MQPLEPGKYFVKCDLDKTCADLAPEVNESSNHDSTLQQMGRKASDPHGVTYSDSSGVVM